MDNPLNKIFKRGDSHRTQVEVIEDVPPEHSQVRTERFRTQWAQEQGEGDMLSTMVLGALDTAVGVQSSTIAKYVDGIKEKFPTADHSVRQAEIDKHFRNIVTGTGAAAGGAAAIPGIGFATGAAAVAGESVVFLEAAAWYILASANLRGIDIKDKELRRALVLLILSGSRGNAVVDTFFDETGEVSNVREIGSVSSLTRFSLPTLQGINSRLAKNFTRQVTKRFKWAWLSKLMPLGIGAVMGGIANRKLAKMVMEHTHDHLDALDG